MSSIVRGWTDTHCHIHDDKMTVSADESLQRARDAGVEKFVVIGTDAETSAAAIAIAQQHSDVWATVGLHPHDSVNGVDSIVSYIASPKVIAIGECGLDYHFGNEDKDKQKLSFITQIKVARDKKLPLIIHSRDADEDMIDILQDEYKKGAFKAILHCFSSGKDLALCGLDLGFYISFSGIVTFNSAKLIQEIACIVPKDRILVETDAPYLAPSPYRGSVNEPKNCFYTAKFLSEIFVERQMKN